MKITGKTEKRAEVLVLAAASLGKGIYMRSPRGDRQRFSRAEVARLAQRARRVAADATCLAALLERAAGRAATVAESDAAHAADEIARQESAHPGT